MSYMGRCFLEILIETILGYDFASEEDYVCLIMPVSRIGRNFYHYNYLRRKTLSATTKLSEDQLVPRWGGAFVGNQDVLLV
jgi:hypothetical protein